MDDRWPSDSFFGTILSYLVFIYYNAISFFGTALSYLVIIYYNAISFFGTV